MITRCLPMMQHKKTVDSSIQQINELLLLLTILYKDKKIKMPISKPLHNATVYNTIWRDFYKSGKHFIRRCNN